MTSGSKEIAQILGIEPGTVDQHIKAATKALGESSRHAAARKYLISEGGTPLQKLDSQSPSVAEPVVALPLEVTETVSQPVGLDWTMREEQTPFVVESSPHPGIPWPFATKGRPSNDLTWGQTLIVSGVLSLVLATASGAMLAGVVLLMNFLISVSRHGG